MLADPYPLLRQLREGGPVQRLDDGRWLALSYDACVRVLRDPHFGIDAEAMGRARGGDRWREHPSLRLLSETLLVVNPPIHTRLRSAVTAAFGADRVKSMAGSIAAAVDQLLDVLPTDEPADLIDGFADRLPLEVMRPVLGIQRWPHGDFRMQTMRFNLVLERELTPARLADADAAAVEIEQCLQELLAERRADPRDDLISQLQQACAQGLLAEQEIVPLVFQIFNASYQTTASLLGNALHALLGDGGLGGGGLGALQGDPELVAGVVREVLRTDPPVQSTGRYARQPVELMGHQIDEGDFVIAVLASGNRDPRRFADPDAFDPRREAAHALSFGWGVHHCLGAGLATLEAEIALGRLADRFPAMRPAGDARRWPTANMRAFASFPALLRPAPSQPTPSQPTPSHPAQLPPTIGQPER